MSSTTKERTLAFSLAVVALLQGFANLAGDSARVRMVAWEEEGNVSDPKQWNVAYQRLRLARQLSPLDADYSADLGRLMEWHSWMQSPESEDSLSSRVRAENYYRESIGRRPTWGFVWAHFAENQLLQGRSGREFQFALRKSIELSPWEPGVQRKVAWMGMAAWKFLPEHLRASVKESIERAVQLDVHRHEIVRLAVQYDWLGHLRPMMRTESQIKTFDFVLNQIEGR